MLYFINKNWTVSSITDAFFNRFARFNGFFAKLHCNECIFLRVQFYPDVIKPLIAFRC